MKAINTIKTDLIDKILIIENRELLQALETLISSATNDKSVKLSDAQKAMLQLSEEDIRYDRLTSQEDLDEEDMAWLSGK
jgi:hypothetical protein